MVSNANTTEVSTAREAPANSAAMPTSAASRGSRCSHGAQRAAARPSSAPSAPPMVNSGASVPPEVPLPSAIYHDRNFSRNSDASAARPTCPATIAAMLA